MLRADYLVVTVEMTEQVQAAYPIMVAYWLPEPKPYVLYGYRGFRSGKVFLGDNGQRILVQATGAIAHDVAMRFPLHPEHPLSVARIDVQATIWTQDADRLISLCEPNRTYRSVRYTNVYEPGATLYVGAPKSNIRLRLYNKTAESGIKPPLPGDYLRVELQFRNMQADRMFRAIRGRAPRFPWLLQVKRMIDSYTYSIIEREVSKGDAELFQEDDDPGLDAHSRRKAWIERSVIPAIRRVLAEEPEYRDTLINLIDDPTEGGIQC